MKIFTFVIASLIAGVSFAQAAPALEDLACSLSNGVTIIGTQAEKDGLKVDTQWGYFKRSFTAVLAEQQPADQVAIDLKDAGGKSAYLIYLPIKLTTTQPQQAQGTVVQRNAWNSKVLNFIAHASCKVRLAQ